jgi:anti-sigma-K factor RskA
MNYDSQELLARLADEYVLGTLRGPARTRFERVVVSHGTAREEVRRAEEQMLGLSLALAPVQPSPETWMAIAERLGVRGVAQQAGLRQRNARSTWRMALAAAVALFAIGIAWVVIERTPPPTAMANLAAADGAPLWNVATYEDGARMDVAVAGVVMPQPGRSYELWALPEGGAPVSLGLLPESGERSRDLTSAQRTALRTSAKVAVSLEPSGGSRTGAPTGPVLYVAELRASPTPT